MKWASLSLLALALSLSSSDRAVSQTLSPREQIRQRVNDNVLFLMGGNPAPPSASLPTTFPWWWRAEIIYECCLWSVLRQYRTWRTSFTCEGSTWR